ncbi:hypothetical protein M5689_016919 [Euphorbia peplus]|nr:hypothetical protein M5689_016919 [Euphorbia peplus]
MASEPFFFPSLFNLVSWPSFVLLLPLCASFCAIESGSPSKNKQCLTFWVLFAVSALFSPTFTKILLWIPFWPYVKGVMTFLLVVPYFWGASYVYMSSLRPYLVKGACKFFLIRNIVFLLTRKCLSVCGIFIFLHRFCFSSTRQNNFPSWTDKTVAVNGQDESEKNLVSQLTSNLHYDNIERYCNPISNEVPNKRTCERCFKEYLRVEQPKAKEKARAEELALKLRCNFPYMANRQNAAALVRNLVNLENWRGLIDSPSVESIRLCSWRKPDIGWVKLNTDGSIDREKAGLGGLLRDYNGNPVCAFVSKVYLDDIFLVELYAIWKGLVLAQGLGVKVVWVESDSMSAVKTINRKQFHNGKADKYLEHIWGLLKKFDKQQVSHSWRETNRAADYLSKMVLETDDVILWPCDFPLSLHNIIEDDAQGRLYIRR